MSDAPTKCPNCAAAIHSPRATQCDYCGTMLPAVIAASAPANAPRTMTPEAAPSRRAGGGFVAILFFVVVMAFAVLSLGFCAIQRAPPPSAAPDAPTPSKDR